MKILVLKPLIPGQIQRSFLLRIMTYMYTCTGVWQDSLGDLEPHYELQTPDHLFWGHPAGETSHFNTKQDICLSIRQPPQLSASTNFISFFIFIFRPVQIDFERAPKGLDLSMKTKNIPNVFDFFSN